MRQTSHEPGAEAKAACLLAELVPRIMGTGPGKAEQLDFAHQALSAIKSLRKTARSQVLLNREFPLWTAAVALGVLSIVLTELRLGGAFGFETGRMVGFAIFFANIAVALYGIWRRQRVLWVVYLGLSLVLFMLIGATEPVSAIWTMAKFLL